MLCGQSFVQRIMLPLLFVACVESSAVAEWIDLREAVIAAPQAGTIIDTAQRVLTEEIARRTGISLIAAQTPANGQNPCIQLCVADQAPAHLSSFVQGMNVPEQPASFSIAVNNSGSKPLIVLAGRDQRGVLYAVGRLLLQL
ncbi:MAG: hypothetical protein KDB01_22185, partial [Planctomycetaceae bacterium]|nr:hypothetical protein [Planctomycetaceae bacterium]